MCFRQRDNINSEKRKTTVSNPEQQLKGDKSIIERHTSLMLGVVHSPVIVSWVISLRDGMHVIMKLPSSHPSSSVTGSIIRLFPMHDFLKYRRNHFSVSVLELIDNSRLIIYLKLMALLFISVYVLLFHIMLINSTVIPEKLL